jgi:hypothetical protein
VLWVARLPVAVVEPDPTATKRSRDAAERIASNLPPSLTPDP